MFVVKKKNTGSFNAVAPDVKLEQTVQSSKKGSWCITGQTRQKAFFSAWDLVYHAISNSFSKITKLGKLNEVRMVSKMQKLYFVKVLHGKSTCLTFNEFQYVTFLLLFFQLIIFLRYSIQQKSDMEGR